jgi:cytochrome c-type biogenesis protein CcmH/NrfF
VSGSRREFLRRLSYGAYPLFMAAGRQQDSSAQRPMRTWANGGTPADSLPYQFGTGRTAVGPLDNDPGVIAIEQKLRCSCGCTLDVYTCRTTDFSCTYSPRMHAIVVAKVQAGQDAQQILDWFVAQPEDEFGGHKVLMAPPARGFNLMGYLVPGFTVVAAGGLLVAWLLRRRPVIAAPDGPTAIAGLDAAKLAELRRALDDVES